MTREERAEWLESWAKHFYREAMYIANEAIDPEHGQRMAAQYKELANFHRRLAALYREPDGAIWTDEDWEMAIVDPDDPSAKKGTTFLYLDSLEGDNE